MVEKPRSPLHGRPRKLTSLDVEVRRLLSVVCFSCELCCTALQYLEARLEREPDMYMSELRDALRLGRGIDVSEKTIKAALKRRGLTYKQVRGHLNNICHLGISLTGPHS